MFMQKLRKNKKGLSMIELVCAIAILSIITTTVGGAMVFASNSYRRGTVDTALQQEAQFTANAIESLIIDATSTVEFSGGVLTIKNTDYTYVITYNSTEKTLRYTQYDTNDPTIVVATDELLAEHVVKFEVDTKHFATARNVYLEIGLENGESTFVTQYNITSRNDASAGDKTEVTASILCEDNIVLEPLQPYFLGVSVVGPADTTFSCAIESETGLSPDTSATVVAGGIDIKLGATETGGEDGLIRLVISTNAKDSSGNPFSKLVTVNVRRVNSISFSTLSLVSGTALKTGATYSVTATAEGQNLAEVVGKPFDSNEHAYIDPNTIEWSFKLSNGDAWTDWVSVGSTGSDDNTIEFTLLQDIVKGVTLEAIATAQHPEGVQKSGLWTNKASRYNVGTTQYGHVEAPIPFKVSNMFSGDIRRGDESYLSSNITYSELIQEEWERNNPGGTWDPKLGYNGGFEGITHIRFISEDGENTSNNYPYWKPMTDKGDETKAIKFNSADFNEMLYMKDYTLELYFAFKYRDFNNVEHTYPADFNPNNPNPDPTYLASVELQAMSVEFDEIMSVDGNAKDIKSYLNDDHNGIGSESNPLILPKSYNVTFKYNSLGNLPNNKAGFPSTYQNMKIYKRGENGWEEVTTRSFNNSANGDKCSGTLSFETVNNLPTDTVLKMVMNDVTSTAGTEVYSEDNPTGASGRGLIYFKIK